MSTDETYKQALADIQSILFEYNPNRALIDNCMFKIEQVVSRVIGEVQVQSYKEITKQ